MRFYALTTKANCERMAVEDLDRLGFTHAAAPLLSKTIPSRRNKAKRIETLHPFFRGYVFVGLPAERERSDYFPIGWHAAERANGALRFVRFGAAIGPSPLPIGFVEAFSEAMDPKGVVHMPHAQAVVDPLRARMAAHEAVRLLIKDGPFAGFRATTVPALSKKAVVDAIARLDTRGRVDIFASVFGRITSMEVNRDQVEIDDLGIDGQVGAPHSSDRGAQAQRPAFGTPRLIARRA